MNYKKIIKSREVRLKLLKFLSFVPDSLMLRIQYFIKMGHRLKLANPKRYTEKIQWYKLYYKDPEMVRCVDKYDVRDYICEKGLENCLIPCFGVYNKAEDIDFSVLPNQFVVKNTIGGGGNAVIICKNKCKEDIEAIRSIAKSWICPNTIDGGREWPYYSGREPRIVIEKYMTERVNGIDEEIRDYKFLCFNGKVKYIWIDLDRHIEHKRNFYDVNWNFIDVSSEYPNVGNIIPKPEGLDKMKEVAGILCKDFPHVRVDLYYINGRVYFGELTFFSSSGYADFNPDLFDYTLGDCFELPHIRRG